MGVFTGEIGAETEAIQGKGGLCGLGIGGEEEIADTAGEQTEDGPADEGEIEDKKIHLFAAHQLFGHANGGDRGERRILRHQVGGHRVAVGGDDAGDDEEKRPEEYKNVHQKAEDKSISEVAEVMEKNAEIGSLTVDEPDKEFPAAKIHCAADHREGNADHGKNGEQAEQDDKNAR